jgi:hypothetical protein
MGIRDRPCDRADTGRRVPVCSRLPLRGERTAGSWGASTHHCAVWTEGWGGKLITPTDPPPGWTQRVKRGLPFPPGIDADRFEIVLDTWLGPHQQYQINERSLHVFHKTADGWDQPSWYELPPRVRARVWRLFRAAFTAATL